MHHDLHGNEAATPHKIRALQLFSCSCVLQFKIICVKDSIAAMHCKLQVMRMRAAEYVDHATAAGDCVTWREVGAMAGVKFGNGWRSEDGSRMCFAPPGLPPYILTRKCQC